MHERCAPLNAARAGAAWICPFVGRLDDISHDGIELIRSIAAIYDADTGAFIRNIGGLGLTPFGLMANK